MHAGDVVYDIGANVGTFSLIAALGRGASVVAFEPGYANFARLCENIWLNSCNELILPVPLPLLDKTAQTRFRYRTLEPGQSRHVIDAVDAPVRSPKQLYGVEQMMCGIRLDEARVLFALPNPNHIKLDVDGTELRALNGALETLRATSLKSVLIEADPDGWPRIEQVSSDAGLSGGEGNSARWSSVVCDRGTKGLSRASDVARGLRLTDGWAILNGRHDLHGRVSGQL